MVEEIENKTTKQPTPGAGGSYLIERPGDEMVLIDRTEPEPPPGAGKQE